MCISFDDIQRVNELKAELAGAALRSLQDKQNESAAAAAGEKKRRKNFRSMFGDSDDELETVVYDGYRHKSLAEADAERKRVEELRTKDCEVEAVRLSLAADLARDAKLSAQAAVSGFKPPWMALRDHGSFEESP